MIIKQQTLNTAIICVFGALMCGSAYAHGHGGGGGHGGHYHNGGYYNHGGVGFYFGPGYYYPYGPYYYPTHTYVVVPQSSAPKKTVTVTTPAKVTVMKAQVQLVSLGYYNDSVDGIIGAHTTAAIIAFQHNKGLAETGMLDDATLKALGVSK